MGARKLYEEQIMQLVHEVPEEKLPGILAHIKKESTEPSRGLKTKEEFRKAIERAQGIFKDSSSTVDNFMKWKNEERALEREQEERISKMISQNIYVIDACALIAYLNGENGSSILKNLLLDANNGENSLIMHKVNVLEAYYDHIRNPAAPQEDFYEIMEDLPIDLIDDLDKSFLIK